MEAFRRKEPTKNLKCRPPNCLCAKLRVHFENVVWHVFHKLWPQIAKLCSATKLWNPKTHLFKIDPLPLTLNFLYMQKRGSRGARGGGYISAGNELGPLLGTSMYEHALSLFYVLYIISHRSHEGGGMSRITPPICFMSYILIVVCFLLRGAAFCAAVHGVRGCADPCHTACSLIVYVCVCIYIYIL